VRILLFNHLVFGGRKTDKYVGSYLCYHLKGILLRKTNENGTEVKARLLAKNSPWAYKSQRKFVLCLRQLGSIFSVLQLNILLRPTHESLRSPSSLFYLFLFCVAYFFSISNIVRLVIELGKNWSLLKT
jgi:hypothetical protein